MKRTAAIFIAIFYLLLTSGMYVCFLSCGTNHLIEFIYSNESSENHHHNGKENHGDEKSEKHCKGGEDCSCCKKHGNYSVKENIKPEGNFQLLEMPLIAKNISYSVFYINYTFIVNTQAWPKSNAPPPGISAPIFIKIRSLLI